MSADFVRANSVFAIDDHPHSGQPLIQTKRRILEYGSDFGAELALLVRALTLPFLLLGKERHVIASARRTDNAIRPTTGDKVAQAVVRVREIDNRFLKCFGTGILCHSERTIAQST